MERFTLYFQVLIFTVLFSPLSAQSKGGIPAEEYYQKGKIAHQAGRLYEAVDWYDMAIDRDSRHANALFNRGTAFASLPIPKSEKAWADFNQVLNIDPNDQGALLWRAKLSYNSGRYNIAIQDYTALLISPNADFSLYVNRGLAYLKNSNFQYAMEDFDAAIRLDPSHEVALASKGQCALALKKYPEAISAYQAAIGLSPNAVLHRYRLAEAYLKNGQYADAKGILEALVFGNVEATAKSLAFLANCYLQLGALEDAKLTAEAATDKERTCAEAYKVLGLIAFEEKDYDKAAERLREAVEWDKTGTEAYIGLAEVFLAKNEFAVAKAYADEAVRLDALSGEAFYARARAHEGLSLLQNACDDYFKAKSLDFASKPGSFDFCEK